MSTLHRPAMPDDQPTNARRRHFLAGSLLGATAVFLGSTSRSWALQDPATLTAKAPDGFAALSRLFTGHPVDDALSDRAWRALISRDAGFGASYSKLAEGIRSANIATYDAWAASPLAADTALKATALAIVSAWYLGVVGEVKDRSEDGPAFITYEAALMWRPTMDVTVIPTYARGGPGFWKDKPPSVATD